MKTLSKTLVLLFVIYHSLFTSSLAQEIEWQTTIGGNDNDVLYSMQQTTDGGYILGGWSFSDISGDKAENSNGGRDYWIVKTDAAGNIQWQNTIGGISEDWLISIQQTADEGYILGGHSQSNISGDKTESSNGFYDFWIVKTDSLGNIQWQNTIGGGNQDELCSIRQTADGGYIFGGYSDSDISGDKTENSIGGEDYWIVKTDAMGNIQWENTIGGNSDDRLYSIQQTADGGYILGGRSSSNISGDKTQNCAGGYDYWIVKTDATGNIQWQKTIGGSDHDHLLSIQQPAIGGGYVLGGYSKSNISGHKTENCKGFNDYWIVKTDAAGSIQWQNTIGGISYDHLHSIQQTSDGGYILGGNSASNISGDKTENNCDPSMNSYEYWIIKTDAAGNIQWQNTIGGSNFDQLSSIQQTADGGYILGGYSDSDISGDKMENSNGSGDFWIVRLTDKYNSITGKCFSDDNNNNVHDSGEVYLTNKKITEANTGRFALSEQNGNYTVSVLDTGNFIVIPYALNYFNAVPASYNVNFAGIKQTDSLNDFAFQSAGVINDLRITITPLTLFRSGFNATYTMHYQNAGTTTLNASVVLYFNDTNYSYVSSSVNPALVTIDSLVWNNISLAPFQSGYITVTIYVEPGLPIGTQLNALCLINPLSGDSTQGDNWGSWKVFSVGSLDPNDILVNENILTTVQLATQPYLEYIIRFQNTGNDTAFTVKILNPIDTNKLELNTIEFVASSHPVNLKWIPWERNMEFKFDNILLPDSNINEPLSHGYVRYRIKPKGTLTAGDSITNSAGIYFDFNAPVLTNTAVTKIVLPTSVNELVFDSGQLTAYPNPSKDLITIGNLQKTIGNEICISDVFGKLIFRKQITSNNCHLNIANWPAGVYFVKAGNSNTKFLKQ